MAEEYKLPDLGEGVDSADVLNVLVEPGDTIESETPLLEVETDKAVMEVPSSVSGTVVEIKVGKGDKVEKGMVILTFEGGATAVAPAPAEEPTAPVVEAAPAPAADSGAVLEFTIPDMGEGVDSADVLNVLVESGDSIENETPLLEVETDKAVMEVPSSVVGEVVEVKIGKGDKVEKGAVVLTYKAVAGSAAPAPTPAAPTPAPTPAAATAPAPVEAKPVTPATPAAAVKSGGKPDGKMPVFAAPSTRQFAREIGVDITDVPGSGPGGKISVDDVKKFVRENGTGIGTAAATDVTPETEVEPMSKVRKVTAAHMEKCWQSPHVTLFQKADCTDLEAYRQKYKGYVEKKAGKLTVTAFMVKIVSAALKHPSFRSFNASLDMPGEKIIYKNSVNIGIAADTPRGLVVPVIKDADQLNVFEIVKQLTELSGLARDGKLTPAQMSGATFTITNLGGIGTDYFTPIVNNPEVAILGLGRANMEPTWDGNEFKPRLQMPMSLSFDHRIIDGADGGRFLNWIATAVKEPLLLAMEG